mmetsp:Transcript_25711/g.79306  ORF Transcript_25711/g.79306 Transcript_25711/m.79306 type:complete len:220 (-) Transcript_25711:120-779(-)
MAVHRSFVATAAVTLWAMVCVVVVLGGIEFAYADGETAEDFQCHLCREMVGDLRQHNALRDAPTTWGDVRAHLASNGASYCSAFRVGKFSPCDVVVPAVDKLSLVEGSQTIESSPIGACMQLGLCPRGPHPRPPPRSRRGGRPRPRARHEGRPRARQPRVRLRPHLLRRQRRPQPLGRLHELLLVQCPVPLRVDGEVAAHHRRADQHVGPERDDLRHRR